MSFLLLATICSAERKIFPAKGVDFKQFKTYEIMTPRLATKTGIQDDDPRFAPVFRQIVEREMAARGYTKVEKGGDLQVLTAAIGDKSPQLEAIFVFFNYATDYGYPSGYGTMSRVNREGTVILGFIETKSKKGLWVGVYTAGLGRPGTEEKTVEKGMAELFEKFPVKK